MRIVLFAATAALTLLAGCKGSESSQADNAQANRSAAASPPATINASLVAAPVSKADAAKIMHVRHEGMEDIGKANKVLRRELTGSSPDLAVVRPAAATIADLSSKASSWFPRGTGPDVGKTGAKPEIWQKPEDFASKMRNFQAAARAFNAAAASGDLGSVKARYADLGKTCKACHDSYRKEMKH